MQEALMYTLKNPTKHWTALVSALSQVFLQSKYSLWAYGNQNTSKWNKHFNIPSDIMILTTYIQNMWEGLHDK